MDNDIEVMMMHFLEFGALMMLLIAVFEDVAVAMDAVDVEQENPLLVVVIVYSYFFSTERIDFGIGIHEYVYHNE